jgi:inorganic pyrophosphatase/exopolyphosphatase
MSTLEEGQASTEEIVKDLKVFWVTPLEIPVEVPQVETYQEPLWELAE